MKKHRRLFIWMALGIFFEVVFLFYINNYFLQSGYYSKKVIDNKVDIIIPEQAQKIKLSSDGKYLSYCLEDSLYITDTEYNTCSHVKFEQGQEISYYRWVPERYRLIIVGKNIANEKALFTLSYYDALKEELIKVGNFAEGSIESYADDIELSILTNIMYIKIAHIGERNSIYRIDIGKDIQKIKTEHFFIGNIEMIHHEDKLIYEDSVYNKIFATNYILNYNKEINILNCDSLKLLDVDEEDNVYMGKLQNNKISQIIYGKYYSDEKEWKQINLNSSVNENNIYISSNGTIFIRDSLKNIIYDLKNNQQYKYKGEFIQIYDKGIAFIVNSKLEKLQFH